MKFTLTLTVHADASEIADQQVFSMEKDCQYLADVGLSLTESKHLLENLQQVIVQQQAQEYLRQQCLQLSAKCWLKDYQPLTIKTLFGTVTIRSPRYKVGQGDKVKVITPLRTLFSQRVTPEHLWLETKWAALLPYNKVADLLKEVLPIGQKLNAATIRNHVGLIAGQIEAGLVDNPPTSSHASLPEENLEAGPEGPIVMGVDGGYLRDWNKKKTCFEVIAGKSIPTGQPAKCFGFLPNSGPKVKQHILAVLKEQGFRSSGEPDQPTVVFLTDGAANLHQLQEEIVPRSVHILDWFHLTMRFTVIQQYLLGLTKVDPDGKQMQEQLTSAKWNLWHGSVEKALARELTWSVDFHEQEATMKYGKVKPLVRYINDLESYIRLNAHLIVDYSERFRYGEAISSGFVESAINQVVAKNVSTSDSRCNGVVPEPTTCC